MVELLLSVDTAIGLSTCAAAAAALTTADVVKNAMTPCDQ